MKDIIFLSCDRLKNDLLDDKLALPYLADLGFQVKSTDWRSFDPHTPAAGVLVRTTWDYHLHLKEFLALLEKIESHGTPLANPAELIRWNCDKIYLQELKTKGIAIPPSDFFTLESETQLSELIARNPQADWIIKPQVSLNAHNTFWIKTSQSENIAKAAAALIKTPVILQPFCSEILDPGEISMVFFNGEFSHAALKTPKDGDFRVQADHGGYIRYHSPKSSEIHFAEKVLEALPLKPLYARVDMIPHPEGPWLMEVELIEPSLYLDTHPEAPKNLASALAAWLSEA